MEVINVSKHYAHSIILKDINFALNKGEIVGLVGRNGVWQEYIDENSCSE